MLFRQLFDRETCTYTYLLADEESREAVILDPVLELHGRDRSLVEELELELRFSLETHVHADHITGGGLLRKAFGCALAVSKRAATDAYDRLLADGERLEFGRYALEARATPGHTDTCLTYVCHEPRLAFTGDALFVRGCGRTDFQSGDAATLYASVYGRILSLPEDTLIYPGHDYQGRTVTTVAEEKAFNPRLGRGKSEADFVDLMDKLNLAPPKRIDVAVPGNLRAGL